MFAFNCMCRFHVKLLTTILDLSMLETCLKLGLQWFCIHVNRSLRIASHVFSLGEACEIFS